MPGQGDYRDRRRNRSPAIPRTQKVAARRRRAPDELYVGQTDDLAAVARMLAAGGGKAEIFAGKGLDAPGGCWLAAWLGGRMVGIVGIETIVDAAMMRSLFVVEEARGRGAESALIKAARKAAHTRGARRLYVLGCGVAEYLKRFGFEPVARAEMIDDLKGSFVADYLEAHRGKLERMETLCLDISRDGIIARAAE